MIHNRVASLAALARSQRAVLDMSAIETTVQTAMYAAMLDAFVELATPAHQQTVADGAARAVTAGIAAAQISNGTL